MNWESLWPKAVAVLAILAATWLVVFAVAWLIQSSARQKEHGRFETPSRPEDKIYNKRPGKLFTEVYDLEDLSPENGVRVRPAQYFRVVDGQIVGRKDNEAHPK